MLLPRQKRILGRLCANARRIFEDLRRERAETPSMARRSCVMWRIVATCLAVLLLVSPASARHWHWHRHHHHHHSRALLERPAPATGNGSGQSIEQNRPTAIKQSAEGPPPGWSVNASDSKTGRKRFVSPQGRAWFEVYSSDVAKQSISDHMRGVAFADGETLTFIRGESDRIEVAGVKEDRKFYRKAILAWAGRVWHELAFEYPVI